MNAKQKKKVDAAVTREQLKKPITKIGFIPGDDGKVVLVSRQTKPLTAEEIATRAEATLQQMDVRSAYPIEHDLTTRVEVAPVLTESERSEDARLHRQAEHISEKLELLVVVSQAAGALANALLALTNQTGEDPSEQAIPLINMLFKRRQVPVAMLRSERKKPEPKVTP